MRAGLEFQCVFLRNYGGSSSALRFHFSSPPFPSLPRRGDHTFSCIRANATIVIFIIVQLRVLGEIALRVCFVVAVPNRSRLCFCVPSGGPIDSGP